MDSKKPVCKYGSACYRRNPDHLRQFSHPDKDEEPATSSKAAKRKSKEEKGVAQPIKGGGTQKQKKDGKITAYFGTTTQEKGGQHDSESQLSSSSDHGSPPSKRLKEDLSQASAPTDADDLPQPPCKEDWAHEEHPGTSSVVQDDEELSLETTDVRVNVKRKFLVEMPEDFYQFWDLCSSLNPAQPDAALQSTLGLLLVGPYHVLAGKLKGVPWRQCVLHSRHYYDPPEFITIMEKADNDNGFHIGYFRDDPKSMDCLVVSNCSKDGCEVHIEGDSVFSAVKYQIAGILNSKQVSDDEKKKVRELDNQIISFMTERGVATSHSTVKDLWKQRHKVTVTNCFHKIGIVVPYDKKTELGYRSLTMSDRDLNKLLNKIVNCKQEEKRRDQAFEPLQELVTFVQFANDECDYGMGLELGLDLFCHGDTYFHTLIEHLLPVAYDLLQREEYSKICLEHLKQRRFEPHDFSH